eukprot:CAMPEP_0203675496 /NCGR_PEP_ID=MMETSP0090-20130426/20791_1 /ASSEMBLY_ACC=CAM_ASM_001088 /TAXON_ID=426623 /ORGANISM="Chaetoceros affinis, Strain CCMP159" /LENGTH=307 /DNA_ID=CAMNT_0050541711 /DNA_START=59 /DNA_END=982 /DNA_ORIENTATION=-
MNWPLSLLTIFLLFLPSYQASINNHSPKFGRISESEYILTPEQIKDFHSSGCCTLHNVLSPEEVDTIEETFDRFLNREIHVPGKDFCDMSKPFDTPFEQWSIVNCMLPTKYYPQFANNVYEKLCACIARQLFPEMDMTKDYDQLLNKRPGKTDAVFSWHQDMGYWPSASVLGVKETETCTFSLAVDDSTEENGCLRYVPGSHIDKKLRPHVPLGDSRDDSHALTIEVDESKGDIVKLAPASRGSITIHNEYVVHGSAGNNCKDRQRRTYVVAFRPKSVVEAERRIGFSHSHNDETNWDNFEDVLDKP